MPLDPKIVDEIIHDGQVHTFLGEPIESLSKRELLAALITALKERDRFRELAQERNARLFRK
ncbi:hypothetical protein ABTM86_19735 [Acinetobacter baumannii]